MSLAEPTSFRAAQRQLVQRVPGVRATDAGAPVLERTPATAETPYFMDAEAVEDAVVRARRVPSEPMAGFAAFLDGAQSSRLLGWWGVAPLVYGSVGAVVLRRDARRLRAWVPPRIERHVYAPFEYASDPDLARAMPGVPLVDTTPPDKHGQRPVPHPALLLERATQAVSRAREAVEQKLAEQWCTSAAEPVMIDGGIGGSALVASAACAVGVVKSHRAIYVGASEAETVLTLAAGCRTSVIRIAPRERSAVLSWYLRLRPADGHDLLWGLVRIEVAVAGDDVGARADAVSRWVMAEAAPLALPDSRWDRMAYGIRRCEDLLRVAL